MQQQNSNKDFITNYYKAMATGAPKTKEFLQKYMTDEGLLSHIQFFEAAFAGYEVCADEMTAEENRVLVQARFKGTHTGHLGDIPATQKTVEFPFVIKYVIEDEMIVSHWILADQMALMQQLGVMPAAEPAH